MIRRYLLDTGIAQDFQADRHGVLIIQQIDMQIGAIARTLPNCVIVSKDSDILAIPGVTVENWAL